MKVLVFVLVLGAASAARSGPYLPSGWKPSGPAFLLPTEVKKQVDNPLKEALQVEVEAEVEAEAEGSDFLKEYGPPKVEEVSQDITQQDLPAIVTEQTFAAIEAKTEEKSELKELSVSTEEKTELKEQTFNLKSVVDEVAVETSANDAVNEVEGTEKSTEEATEKSLDVTQSDVSAVTEQAITEGFEEQTEGIVAGLDLLEENVGAVVAGKVEENVVVTEAEERRGKSVDEEVEAEVTKVGEVRNIADALLNLENEIKSQQVQTVEENVEVKTVQENAGVSEQVPEGFLEYGPPGFSEYGPPKELLRSGVEKSDDEAETNETRRRRRFSPKFRIVRRASH